MCTTMPELTCMTTCPLCSQRPDLTVDDLRPMVPFETLWDNETVSRSCMRCVVCEVVCKLPGGNYDAVD